MDLSPGRVMEPCRLRAGRTIWVFDVAAIPFSLNGFRLIALRGNCERSHLRTSKLTFLKKQRGGRFPTALLCAVVACCERILPTEAEAVAIVAVIVIFFSGRSEGNATKNLSEAGLADDGELLLGGCSRVGVGEGVGDGDEAVGVCALVSATADGGGDAVEGDLAIAIDCAGEVADAVGCGRPGKVGGGVIAGGVVVDDVGDAEFEASLERVGEAPGLGRRVEDP